MVSPCETSSNVLDKSTQCFRSNTYASCKTIKVLDAKLKKGDEKGKELNSVTEQ